MDARKALYLVSLKRIVSYAQKATLNLLATELGNTGRFKGAGRSDRVTDNGISPVF